MLIAWLRILRRRWAVIFITYVFVYACFFFVYSQNKDRVRRFSLVEVVLLSMLTAIGAGVLTDRIAQQVHTELDVQKHVGLPVLATVPFLEKSKRRLAGDAPPGPLHDIFDALVTTLMAQPRASPLRTLAVLGPAGHEGRTTVGYNIAIAAARQGKRVLLAELDFRAPKLSSMLAIAHGVGFSQLIVSDQIPAETLLADGAVPNLKILVAGPSPENIEAALEIDRLRPRVRAISEAFDLTLLLAPPLLAVGDGLKVAVASDAALLVVAGQETIIPHAILAKNLLVNAGVRIEGTVLNKARECGPLPENPPTR